MIEFTPGPWKNYIEFIARKGGRAIATIAPNNPNSEANARLIAAAPDLLRTVSDAAHIITYMLDGEQDKQDMRDFLEQARAVVVKACNQ